MTSLEILGQSSAHLTRYANDGYEVKGQPEALNAFIELKEAAAADGIDLRIASAYRNFERQVRIWNEKFSGIRPSLDQKGELVDIASLGDKEALEAVLRWSALPGTSRHHWGTDFDVYDASAIEPNYKLLLTAQESRTVFKKLHEWLDERLTLFHFYRPYATDRGGVHPEDWHISFYPLATNCAAMVDEHLVSVALGKVELARKKSVLAHLSWILTQFVNNIDPVPAPRQKSSRS